MIDELARYSFCVNVGASVSNVFGPLIVQTLIGFTPSQAILLSE